MYEHPTHVPLSHHASVMKHHLKTIIKYSKTLSQSRPLNQAQDPSEQSQGLPPKEVHR